MKNWIQGNVKIELYLNCSKRDSIIESAKNESSKSFDVWYFESKNETTWLISDLTILLFFVYIS